MVINSRLKVFIIVGLIFSSIYVFLMFQHKVPFEHDTFQYLQLQYIYFNEIVQNHSIPIWFPFMSQGNAGNYYFTPQLTILSPIFYLIGLFFKNINYLYLFYFALLFEELFFLLGVVLLSSLYYKETKTIFFVSITLLGTSIWYPQIWWNFHLFYFIPIVLYCIHKCFITGAFRYLIFSIIFFTLSVYGNFIYCIIFSLFVILSYILLIILIDFSSNLNNIKVFFQRNMKLKNIVVFLILISIIALSFYYIKYTDNEIAYIGFARDASGENYLNTFLTYGGSIGLRKYIEIFARSGKSFDINLYAGFLLVPFVLIALLYVRKKLSFVVGGISLMIFLFSIGTFVSILFYYLFPLGSLFRHIGLTSTVLKLFIVFYAGFGFEIFLKHMYTDKKVHYFISFFLLMLIFLFEPYVLAQSFLLNMLKIERIYLSVLIFILLSGSFVLFYLMARTKIKKEIFFNLLLLIILIDLFSYKYSLIFIRMPSVSKSVIALFKPYKYDFPEKRRNSSFSYLKDNERMKLFTSVDFWLARYNTLDSFFFTDPVVSRYRTDFMLKSIKKYTDINKRFPNDRVYKKYSADSYPKLSVFSRLNVIENEDAMGRIFCSKYFTGDMLFTTDGDIKDIKSSIHPYLIQQQNYTNFKNCNERINANIQIEEFSFNKLKLKIESKGPSDEYCFLYYSSAYHPHWNVYVNDKHTPVLKTNIGYQSVIIPYGKSHVVFKFGNLIYYTSIFCSILLGLFILSSTIYIFIKEIL